MRSADYETSGGINVEFRIIINHILRQDRIKHIFFDIFVDLLLADLRAVLRGQDNRIQAERFTGLVILNRNLSLAIRSEIGQRAVFADLCQLQGQLVGQRNRIRHIFLCLIIRITEHHALVSGSDCINIRVRHGIFFRFQRLINAQRDICRLFIQRCYHRAGFRVKSIFTACISDLRNRVAHDLLNIHIRLGGNFAHNHDHTCCRTGLTSHAAHWVLCNEGVQDRV